MVSVHRSGEVSLKPKCKMKNYQDHDCATKMRVTSLGLGNGRHMKEACRTWEVRSAERCSGRDVGTGSIMDQRRVASMQEHRCSSLRNNLVARARPGIAHAH